MEKSEHQGYWWLPDEPENQVPGTLKFDPDEGARLYLLGSFKGAEDFGPMLDPELILGLSNKGNPLTLRYCAEIKSDLTIGQGFATSSFNCDAVFVGEHFQSHADVGFERLIIEYLHLDAWAGVTGFELGIPDDHKTHPLTVGHTRPEPFTATLEDECEITLCFPATRKTSPPPITEASITQRAELAINYPEKKPLDHLEDIAYRLQHLLSFGTRRSVYPIAMWGATGPVG